MKVKSMKSLIGCSRNIRLFVLKNEEGIHAVPEIEGVFTLMDKVHEFSGTEVISVNKLETFRFHLSLESAKMLQESLTEWIKSAEEVAEKE